MKKCFTTLCILFALATLPQVSKAGTYYVVNGESFTLTAATGSFQYIWTIKTGLVESIQTLPTSSLGVLTHTFSDAATSPTLHTISLGVVQVLDGCLSDVVQDTVIVLPKLTVAVTADKLNFCTDKIVDATLTASIETTVSGLGTYGVTISPFAWTKGGSLIVGAVNPTYDATDAGIYGATVSYILPTSGIFEPTASKLLTSVIPGSEEILHNLAVPLAPVITFN